MDELIKVAFIIDQIDSPTDGTENQVLRLIGRIDRRRFLPHLVVLRSSAFLENDWSGCEVFPLHVRRLFTFRGIIALIKLRSWLRRNRIAVVHTFFKDANVLGLLAAVMAGVPLRLSSRRSLKYADTRGDARLYKLLDRLVHYYVANGVRVKQHVIDSEGVQPERVRVFYNLVGDGLESARCARDGASVLGTSDRTDVVFVMMANLRPVKGHAFLLDTIDKVQESIPRAKFVLVGGGPNGEDPSRTEVFDAVKGSRCSGKFVFAGLQRDVGPFLDSADVGVLCSWSEGFSSALLEYTAKGLPCIATDVGSNSELVVDGFNGFLVQYGDCAQFGEALVALYRDAALRQQLGRNSREHFERHFDPATQLDKLERFYSEELLRRRGLDQAI